MATLVLLNKPFHVMCQFTDDQGRATLADFIATTGVYPAGRLDYDSEGLVLLTDSGKLQHRIASPTNKMKKTYWVQVDGVIDDSALEQLRRGVTLKDGLTRPAQARRIEAPDIWPRTPPIRERANQPTSWLELALTEGRNRQVRRMTAAVGFPTLRLIRARIGEWGLDHLQPGESTTLQVHIPVEQTKGTGQRQSTRPAARSRRQASPNRRSRTQ